MTGTVWLNFPATNPFLYPFNSHSSQFHLPSKPIYQSSFTSSPTIRRLLHLIRKSPSHQRSIETARLSVLFFFPDTTSEHSRITYSPTVYGTSRALAGKLWVVVHSFTEYLAVGGLSTVKFSPRSSSLGYECVCGRETTWG